MSLSWAAHLPSWHRHFPPQSIVPARHSAVHETAAHSGCSVPGLQDVGWQHWAGMQSESVVHSFAAGIGSKVRSFSLATHSPYSQAQPPVQSIVPGSHSALHSTAAHSGCPLPGMQLVAWQHVAGLQSTSAEHSVP